MKCLVASVEGWCPKFFLRVSEGDFFNNLYSYFPCGLKKWAFFAKIVARKRKEANVILANKRIDIGGIG
jgi:hypothetical protein